MTTASSSEQRKADFIQKILDVRVNTNNCRKLYFVQWKQLDASQATWESQQTVKGSSSNLIKEYEKSRKNDKSYNFDYKLNDEISIGQNPYSQTKFYGHFVYGDQPVKVCSLKVYYHRKQGEQVSEKTVQLQIQWKPRQVYNKKSGIIQRVLLQNTRINSKDVMEYDPQFLIKFYQSKVVLNQVQQNYSSQEEPQQQLKEEK